MNDYTQKYKTLNDSINESKKKIEATRNDLVILKQDLYNTAIEISSTNRTINNLISEGNQIVSKKDKLISIPMTLLTIMVEVALVYAGYNIAISPEDILSKIIVSTLTISLGGCTALGIAMYARHLISELEKKQHNRIAKKSPKCQKLSKEIEKERQQMDALVEKHQEIKKEIEDSLNDISVERDLIKIDAQKLHRLENEMIEFVLDEDQAVLESSKAYRRVRAKHNR